MTTFISLHDWCIEHDRLDLIKNWDKNANKSLTVKDISFGSNKKVYLKCSRHNYTYDVTPCQIRNGQGCPVCSGKRVIKGINDLETLFPEVAKEWHSTKNGDITPDQVASKSNKRYWWHCQDCGHEWKATINSRTNLGNGCPKCTKANRVSKKERIVYYFVHKYFESAISSYKPVNGILTEFDIFIPELMIAIEYDGQQYHEFKRDIKKDRLAKDLGITLLRIREPKCDLLTSTSICFLLQSVTKKEDLESVIKQVLAYLFRKANINPIYSVDIEKEDIDYSELFKPDLTFAEANPELVLQWNYELNGKTDPYKVHANLKEEFWFNCSNPDHPPYKMSLNNITQKNKKRYTPNRGCSLCHSYYKTDPGVNDLATLNPDLASKWDYQKNGDLTPSQVLANSHKPYWFIEKGVSKQIKPFNRKF